jgi:hypothetical protein
VTGLAEGPVVACRRLGLAIALTVLGEAIVGAVLFLLFHFSYLRRVKELRSPCNLCAGPGDVILVRVQRQFFAGC